MLFTLPFLDYCFTILFLLGCPLSQRKVQCANSARFKLWTIIVGIRAGHAQRRGGQWGACHNWGFTVHTIWCMFLYILDSGVWLKINFSPFVWSWLSLSLSWASAENILSTSWLIWSVSPSLMNTNMGRLCSVFLASMFAIPHNILHNWRIQSYWSRVFGTKSVIWTEVPWLIWSIRDLVTQFQKNKIQCWRWE